MTQKAPETQKASETQGASETQKASESVVDLLLALRADGIALWTEHGKLRFDAPAGAMTPALRERLVARRTEIVSFLAEADLAECASVRITMTDGVGLAADIYRPKREGVVVEEPLPVVWCHERYRRAEVVNGGVLTKLDSQPWLKEVLRHGYVVAVVDVRGSGASEGVRPIEFHHREAQDAHTVTEWLAEQPWSTGRIGMFGMSYSGINQLLAAGTAPPHLAAIVPQMAMFDLYEFLRPGGVFRDDFARSWGERVRRLDTEVGVANSDGADAADILAEHRLNAQVFDQAAALEFRDSKDATTGLAPYEDVTPAAALDDVNASGVAICHLAGWYDIWVRDTILWYRNLTVPQRMVIGPWSHNGWSDEDIAAEHLRWYDHWLKGVDNGVMDERPIRYFTMSAPVGEEWGTTSEWPPAHVRPQPFHFLEGPTGTVESVNDGVLSAEAGPSPDEGADAYEVDYSATSGPSTRWSDGYGGGFRYDLTANDRRALTYTSPVLTRDLQITGHPLVHLWVTSTHPDAEFFVYLEEVDTNGESHYISEAVIRASHRSLGTAPYDNLGLPYHPGSAGSVLPLPDEPVELIVDMHPTSSVVVAGRRVRICVTCCDSDNAQVPERSPAPVVRIHRGPSHPSRVVLPVAPQL